MSATHDLFDPACLIWFGCQNAISPTRPEVRAVEHNNVIDLPLDQLKVTSPLPRNTCARLTTHMAAMACGQLAPPPRP